MAAQETAALTSPEREPIATFQEAVHDDRITFITFSVLEQLVAGASPAVTRAVRNLYRSYIKTTVQSMKTARRNELAKSKPLIAICTGLGIPQIDIASDLRLLTVGYVYVHNGDWASFEATLVKAKHVCAERLEQVMDVPNTGGSCIELVNCAETYEVSHGEGAMLVAAKKLKDMLDHLEEIQRYADLLQMWKDKPATAYDSSIYQKPPPSEEKKGKGKKGTGKKGRGQKGKTAKDKGV